MVKSETGQSFDGTLKKKRRKKKVKNCWTEAKLKSSKRLDFYGQSERT